MQKIILTLWVIAFCLPAFAQDEDTSSKGISHYVFGDFSTGLVKKKSGQVAHIPLNYNTLTEEMVFIKDTEKLAMTGLEEIDTVYAGGKIFVPGKNFFYEKLTSTPVALYVQRKTNLLPGGSNVGYGMKSETSSVQDLNAIIGSTQVYKLTLPGGYKLVDHSLYWVNKNGRFMQVTNIKKVQAVFPAKAAEIKTFAEANNIKFNNPADMVKLIEFCNQP